MKVFQVSHLRDYLNKSNLYSNFYAFCVFDRAPTSEIENARDQVRTLVNNLHAICLNRWPGWLYCWWRNERMRRYVVFCVCVCVCARARARVFVRSLNK